MKVIKTVIMDAIDRDYIQFLHFEMNSYKNILSYILLEKTKGYEYSLENYKHFMTEYKEAEIKYNIMVVEFVSKYAPEFHGNTDYTVQYNFESCEMVIYRKEDN